MATVQSATLRDTNHAGDQGQEMGDSGAALLSKVDDTLEAHSAWARDSFREWRGEFRFEEKSISQLQRELRDLIAPYPEVAETFTTFLQADTSTEEAALQAKRDLCQLTGMITISVPPGTRQRWQQSTLTFVRWSNDLEKRAAEKNKPELSENVQQEMLGTFNDQDAAAREARHLRIDALLGDEPDLLEQFKTLTGREEAK